jgi:hypothetical protein
LLEAAFFLSLLSLSDTLPPRIHSLLQYTFFLLSLLLS